MLASMALLAVGLSLRNSLCGFGKKYPLLSPVLWERFNNTLGMSDLDQIQEKTERSPQVARQYFYGGEVGDLRLKEL